MIYMPTSLSPDRETISVTDDMIRFTIQIQNGSNIEYLDNTVYTDDDGEKYRLTPVSMTFVIGGQTWFYPFDYGAYTGNVTDDGGAISTIIGKAYAGKYGIKIIVDMDMTVRYFGYNLRDGSNTVSLSNAVYLALNQILRNGSLCSWKMRVYERNTTTDVNACGSIQVGYGVISDVLKKYNSKNTSTLDYIVLKCTPHTNIYDYVEGERLLSNKYPLIPSDSYSSNTNIKNTINEILRYIDINNSHYFIEINGVKYLIDFYRLFNASDYDDDIDDYLDYFDEYGNPIYGYIYLRYADGGHSWDNIKTAYDNKYNGITFEDGVSYSIYTNFIDSKFAYFTLDKEAEITITESKGNDVSNTSLVNPYVLDYCNLTLNVEYSHDNGIFANFYSFKVYEYDERNDNYIFRYSSGNRYNQAIECEYEKFFNHKIYLIEVTIVDSAGRTYEKDVYVKTEFSSYFMGEEATAEFYREHHSVIVDWSNSTSINPNVEGAYSYVSVVNGEVNNESIAMNYVRLGNDCVITYDTDDEGNPLHFENSLVALRVKLDTSTFGKFFEYSSEDGYKAEISYDGKRLTIRTSNGTYEYGSRSNYSKSVIEAVLQKSTLDYRYPYIYDDITKDIECKSSYYLHTEDSMCNGEFLILIKTDVVGSTSVVIKHILDGNREESYLITCDLDDVIYGDGSSYVRYTGNAMYNKMSVVNNYSECSTLDDLLNDTWSWYENSVLLCDYNMTLNGKNYAADLSNVCGYKVYKTFGETDDTLYEVADLEGTDFKVIEDFVVGDMCKYTYYIYPKVIDKDNSELYSIGTVITTAPIEINDGSLVVFGLTEVGDKKYIPNLDEVWTFNLNLSDDGWTMNNDKTYYDNTLSRYNQESIGAGAYVTKSVTSLLGKINCSDGEYAEDYDILVTWMNFVRSSCEKCLVDVRGLVLPGNFEANVTGKYEQAKGSPCTTSFTWRQKSDLDIITIHAIPLPFNPMYQEYLYGSDEMALLGSDSDLLYGSR